MNSTPPALPSSAPAASAASTKLPPPAFASHPAIDAPALGFNLRRAEPWLNAFWIVLGAGVCILSEGLGVFGANGPGSGFFPMLAGAAMAVTGVAQMSARSTRVEAALHFWPEAGAAKRVSLVLGGLLMMMLMMRFAGFIVAALVMTPLLLRAIEQRSWLFVSVVGAVSAAVIFLLFDTLLGTILPRGPFGF